jgi:hypothetical protein
MTGVTAQVAAPSATLTYTVSIDGATVANLTVSVNLGTLEARGTYSVAPSGA